MLVVAGYTITSGIGFVSVHYGVGVHANKLSFDDLIAGLKYQVILELSYILVAAILKTSVGLLLLRITSVKPFYKYLVWASLIIIWLWSIITFIVGCLQCRPLEATWNPLVTGTCIDPRIMTSFAYAISAETIFFDWLFALLPIPMLWNLKMSFRLKVSIVGILGLGIIASSATIVRFKFLIAFSNHTDTLSPVLLWSTIELALGITAASIATLRPLLRRWRICGFTSDPSLSFGSPGGPRSGREYKKSPFNPSDPDASHISNGLHDPPDQTRFSNLQKIPTLSGRSEEGILGGGDEIHGGNGSANGAGNESIGEWGNEEYELVSRPDGKIMTRTEIQIEFDERNSYTGKDMV
ncbi:hypothetical protein SBOR_4396 [Sclerotinia borealis F-4128]|uniref:Rhodopsin domain-containing protein n=1 Tax=Sclerotinia borealis (strain F-4128) TaxID=1432307 RepID=W9CEL9_SCLBF|nr:hypothetical protein SBOR_4396 [Sclerotinia borealis F-4128]